MATREALAHTKQKLIRRLLLRAAFWLILCAAQLIMIITERSLETATKPG